MLVRLLRLAITAVRRAGRQSSGSTRGRPRNPPPGRGRGDFRAGSRARAAGGNGYFGCDKGPNRSAVPWGAETVINQAPPEPARQGRPAHRDGGFLRMWARGPWPVGCGPPFGHGQAVLNPPSTLGRYAGGVHAFSQGHS